MNDAGVGLADSSGNLHGNFGGMGVGQAVQRVEHDRRALLQREPPAVRRQKLVQIHAVDVFQHEIKNRVGFAMIVQLHDVRVFQLARHVYFALKRLDIFRIRRHLRQHDFHRDRLVRAEFPRFIDHAHAAALNHAVNLIPLDLREIAGGAGRRNRIFGLLLFGRVLQQLAEHA